MRRRRKSDTPRVRGGFTLIELMVAVLLIGVGLAGLIATSGAVSRMMGGSIREYTASSVAASRFEKLRASQCASITSGSASTSGTTESWRVTQIRARMFDVTDSITFTSVSRGAVVKQAYRSYVTC
jgi:prepilin-type N-terminal cleavage/methylation domain-containing protein